MSGNVLIEISNLSKVFSNTENQVVALNGISLKVYEGEIYGIVGMSGAGTLAVGSNITAISGATVSTKGITMGANAALAAVEALG